MQTEYTISYREIINFMMDTINGEEIVDMLFKLLRNTGAEIPKNFRTQDAEIYNDDVDGNICVVFETPP